MRPHQAVLPATLRLRIVKSLTQAQLRLQVLPSRGGVEERGMRAAVGVVDHLQKGQQNCLEILNSHGTGNCV